jgi:hypothetical protein
MSDVLMATVVPLLALAAFVGGYTLILSDRPGRVPLPRPFDWLPWRWWARRSPIVRTVVSYLGCAATGLVLAVVIWHPSVPVRAAFLAVLVVPNLWAWRLARRLRRAGRG